jgi:hypothetical protein
MAETAYLVTAGGRRVSVQSPAVAEVCSRLGYRVAAISGGLR